MKKAPEEERIHQDYVQDDEEPEQENFNPGINRKKVKNYFKYSEDDYNQEMINDDYKEAEQDFVFDDTDSNLNLEIVDVENNDRVENIENEEEEKLEIKNVDEQMVTEKVIAKRKLELKKQEKTAEENKDEEEEETIEQTEESSMRDGTTAKNEP